MAKAKYPSRFISELQVHQTRISIAASTVRSQGKGNVRLARQFFAKDFEIGKLRTPSERAYLSRLDAATEALRGRLSGKGKTFGLARKLLNIYIRDCVYSRILCAHYRLEQIEPFLEVPLDGIVGGALVKAACDRGQLRRLPRWRTIKGLTREDSETYQAFASELAEEKGLARVHLDVVLWGARG
jgi:hypothetical protein